jgi:hypothetical protein
MAKFSHKAKPRIVIEQTYTPFQSMVIFRFFYNVYQRTQPCCSNGRQFGRIPYTDFAGFQLAVVRIREDDGTRFVASVTAGKRLSFTPMLWSETIATTRSRRPESSMSKLQIFLGVLLIAVPLMNSSRAEDKIVRPEPSPNPPYPVQSEILFQMNYSCPSSRACSFNCPGVGSASNVTTLDLYVGTIPMGKDQNSPALFYVFSTAQLPRGNGFNISNGALTSLACQVNGMKQDYAGPAK